MTLVIAGTVRVPADQLDGLRPHMLTMLAASRAEDDELRPLPARAASPKS